MKKAGVIATLLAGMALLVTASVALADANNKRPDYESEASSSAGLDILGLVQVGHTSSDSTTNKGGAEAHSQASGVALLGMGLGPTATCAAVGEPRSGQRSEEDSDELLAINEGPVSATVLAASCRARAVQSTNAESEADSTTLAAEVEDVASATVLDSHSDNKTTSGQARSSARFTVAEANVLGTELTVIECTSSSKANNGGSSTSSEVTLINGVTTEGPCPLAESEASYTKN